jgi:hypothetical protein
LFYPFFSLLLATENLKKSVCWKKETLFRILAIHHQWKKKKEGWLANSGHLKENRTKSMNLNPKKVIQDPKKRGWGPKKSMESAI